MHLSITSTSEVPERWWVQRTPTDKPIVGYFEVRQVPEDGPPRYYVTMNDKKIYFSIGETQDMFEGFKFILHEAQGYLHSTKRWMQDLDSSNHFVEAKTYHVKDGFHLLKNKEDVYLPAFSWAKGSSRYVGKFEIPGDTDYMEGYFNEDRLKGSYISQKITLVDIVKPEEDAQVHE